MRRYTYIEENPSPSASAYAWFHRIRGQRLLRQAFRNDPAKLAVLFAEIHLGVPQW